MVGFSSKLLIVAVISLVITASTIVGYDYFSGVSDDKSTDEWWWPVGLKADVIIVNTSISLTPNIRYTPNLESQCLELPHCSCVYFKKNTLTVHGYGKKWNNPTVVLVRYPDRISFSGGGDDVNPAFLLKKKDTLTVEAALNTSMKLYEITNIPDNRILAFSPVEMFDNKVDVTYKVMGTDKTEHSVWENHSIEEHSNIPVSLKKHCYCN